MKNIGGDTEEHGRRILETMERDMEGGICHGRAYEETMNNIAGGTLGAWKEKTEEWKETWKVRSDMAGHRRRQLIT
jgi:hypothetical protein